LKLFLGFFFFQSGALLDVAEQNPKIVTNKYYYKKKRQVYLSVFLLIVFSKRPFAGCCVAKSKSGKKPLNT